MGQAKRRGTFEQRLAQALERDNAKVVTRPTVAVPSETMPILPLRRRPVVGIALLAAMIASPEKWRHK
jgi:hypothetical protein